MGEAIQEISTITSKGQTTVPKAVRQALGVDTGDRIVFCIDERGVTLQRVAEDAEDPAIDAFLRFLAKDMEAHPERMVTMPPALAARMAELTEGVGTDVDTPIEGDVEL